MTLSGGARLNRANFDKSWLPSLREFLPPKESFTFPDNMLQRWNPETLIGQLKDGSVTEVGRYGVFVSIGLDKDAWLNVPEELWSRFSVNDQIYDCEIEGVDDQTGMLIVKVKDPYEVVKDLR